MSRAAVYQTFGGPEVLELRDVPEPHVGPGEVRVRVTAVGLNPMDWIISSTPEAAAMFGVTVPSGHPRLRVLPAPETERWRPRAVPSSWAPHRRGWCLRASGAQEP